jgi:LAGLIDADG-like domain
MRAGCLNPDLELQAYVIGLAIGDGNLSNPNGRATRLRITCDTKYPALIARIQSALQRLLPTNKVSVVRGTGRALSIQCLRGLIETDGAVYRDRGYPMVIFSTVIFELWEQVDQMIRDLGFRCHFYSVRRSREESPYKYRVRLSRDVVGFLDLVQPLKA